MRWRAALIVLAAVGFGTISPVLASAAESDWYGVDASGEATVVLYFVYSSTCPHCNEAEPFVDDLAQRHSWLRVERLRVDGAGEGVDRALEVADSIGVRLSSVPTFMFCESVMVGYGSADTTGAVLEQQITSCKADLAAGADPDVEEVIEVPVLGDIDPASGSLPLWTVTLAGLDAFNPCAFFVLLFLLSLLVHAGSRGRMMAVGGTFVAISGLVYFAFMTAWLNVFRWLGPLRGVTIVAGLVAIGVAMLNLKDFAGAGWGPSVSMSEDSQGRLSARMRGLVRSPSLAAMMGGTVVLAVAANSYELLCTAGFPMAFTRILTLSELSTPAYYGYLVLYNVVYVVPLLLIVSGFVWTLGRHKLAEFEGRILKLVSGLMMLGLGGLLVFAPEWLDRPATAVGLVAGAIAIAVVAWLSHAVRGRHIAAR